MTAIAAEITPPTRNRRPSLVPGIILAVLLIPVILLFLAATLATTPTGTGRISRELSRILGQHVTIDTLRFRGASLRVQGLAIANAPPFTGNLLAVRSLTIIPTLRIVTGMPSLALLEVNGATLALKQDPSGAWNISPLLQRLRNRPDGGETFIDVLRIQETSLSVNGRLFPIMDLSLRDLATKGSHDSSWRVSFADQKQHPVTITGTARPGSSPAMTLTVEAPKVALSGLAQFITVPPFLDLERGTAVLHLTASLRGDVLATTGILTVADVFVRAKERSIPLTGSVDFTGVYHADRDEARITRGTITLAGLTTLTGTGQIRKVKSDREFSADLTTGALDLGSLRKLLSPEGLKDLTATGTMTVNNLSLAGTARQGLTACRAIVNLEKGAAAWQGRPLVQEMAAAITMDKQTEGWKLAGRITSGAGGPAELRALSGTLSARLAPHFQPLRVEVAPLSGVVRGVDLSGSIRYDVAAAETLTINLMTGTTQVSVLSPYLKERVRIQGGTASVSLEVVANQGLEEIHGTVTAAIDHLAATSVTGNVVTGASANLTGRFRGGKTSPLEATGQFVGNGMLNTKPAEADLLFSLTPRRFQLEQGKFRLDGNRMTFARLYGQVPVRTSVTEIPVSGQIERVNLTWQGLSLQDLSGTVEGVWRTTPDGGRFEGKNDITAKQLSLRTWSTTDISAHLAGDGAGFGGNLTASGLGGTLAASFKTVPFSLPVSPEMPVSFTGSGRKLLATHLMTTIGKPLPVAFTGGLFDADATGSFTRTGGVRLAGTTVGNGLIIAGNGVTIFPDVGMTATGEYDAGRLRLNQGRVTAGEKVAITLSGEVNDLPAATRTGTVTVSLPETSLTDATNAGSGLLPLSLQEVRTEGKVSLNGVVSLMKGRTSLGGELHVIGGEVSLPSRQFSADGIEGTIPFALTFPTAGGVTPRRDSGFSRSTYSQDLTLLKQTMGTPTFRIARIRMGSLETGETWFHLKASENRTELVRFGTTLYGGQLLGRGGFSWDQGPVYDADLLVHDLSLSRFCSTIPAITGYLSGKVDGVVGLHGEQAGLDNILGFFDFWARSTVDEELLVSKEFLQKLAGKKLKGFFFRDDRLYDRGEIRGSLANGYITFSELDIDHTNIFGVHDLSVTVVPTQNRISLEHLITSIKTAAQRGKPAKEGEAPAESLPRTEFKWLE
jgi:hypothetical protein